MHATQKAPPLSPPAAYSRVQNEQLYLEISHYDSSGVVKKASQRIYTTLKMSGTEIRGLPGDRGSAGASYETFYFREQETRL